MYDITSIETLVKSLGGPNELGDAFGISQEAVSNWSVRGNIPGGWHVQLYALAGRKGLTIDPKVFNLTEKDVEGLFPTRRPKRRAEARAA